MGKIRREPPTRRSSVIHKFGVNPRCKLWFTVGEGEIFFNAIVRCKAVLQPLDGIFGRFSKGFYTYIHVHAGEYRAT